MATADENVAPSAELDAGNAGEPDVQLELDSDNSDVAEVAAEAP